MDRALKSVALCDGFALVPAVTSIADGGFLAVLPVAS
jgi:hypothetical protein